MSIITALPLLTFQSSWSLNIQTIAIYAHIALSILPLLFKTVKLTVSMTNTFRGAIERRVHTILLLQSTSALFSCKSEATKEKYW